MTSPALRSAEVRPLIQSNIIPSHSEYLPQIQRAGQAEDQAGEEDGGRDIVELPVLAV